ncbi:hypothetical protein [Pseudaestuariivita sp.]|uniref:hypothetical protein n=1 Tax=Pseudaestuariivita sp. TaxID=2211669 RepID=UPI0040598134
MKRTLTAAALIAAVGASSAFAGGKNEVIIEADPFVPAVVAAESSISPAVLALGAILVVAGIAAASGTD